VINTIHRQAAKPKEPPEQPIVVVMSGLDKTRVKQFAAGQRVKNLEAFIGQIELPISGSLLVSPWISIGSCSSGMATGGWAIWPKCWCLHL
jgi:hypothetical protein